jgi:hypothetical protein
VQNYFGKFPKSSLLQTIVSFYKDDEIATAKVLLFDFVESLVTKPESLPRHVKRHGDNKRNADGDDLLKLFTALDAAKVPLPNYVAVDLMRVPTVAPGDVDIYTLAASMENMKHQMTLVLSRLSAVEARPSPSEQAAVDWPVLPSKAARPSTGVQWMAGQMAPKETQEPSERAARTEGVAGHDKQGEAEWQIVPVSQKKKPIPVTASRQRVPIRVKGARGASSETESIKTVPRREILAAYVGRLHPETTAEELTSYLAKEGIKGIVCKKLLSKDGRKFTTAAFYVTCCAESRDLFYSEHCWPEGAELRDWVYYN